MTIETREIAPTDDPGCGMTVDPEEARRRNLTIAVFSAYGPS